MLSTYHDFYFFHHTSPRVVIAVLLIGILLIVPVSANTAMYYIAENGTSFSAEVTLINQSRYLLFSSGLLGEGAELKVNNLTLIAENGTVVTAHKKSSTELVFPEGNYTLVYEAPIAGYFVYAQYLSSFNTIVFLPSCFLTNNIFLGSVSNGGKIYWVVEDIQRIKKQNNVFTDIEYGTIVVWTDKREIQMRFYPMIYEKYFGLSMCLWFFIFCVVGYYYFRQKWKTKK
ncbi:MAG TPA: hypothetical protein O0W81_02815 [Methanocorpusculum sp.]|nr:hypothetical protein [Methanocorpusculum sp.]